MIIVDTSACIEFTRATGSEVHLRVRELITSDELATTEPVNMEVLAGARDQTHEANLRRFLSRLQHLPLDAAVDFDGAARVYRLCRARGVTPRSLIDCMITSVAMRYKAAVLAHGTDFARIAEVVALELDPTTRR